MGDHTVGARDRGGRGSSFSRSSWREIIRARRPCGGHGYGPGSGHPRPVRGRPGGREPRRVPADSDRGRLPRRRAAFPGQTASSHGPAIDAELGVGCLHRPCSAADLRRAPRPQRGPAQGQLAEPARMLRVEAADAGPPHLRRSGAPRSCHHTHSTLGGRGWRGNGWTSTSTRTPPTTDHEWRLTRAPGLCLGCRSAPDRTGTAMCCSSSAVCSASAQGRVAGSAQSRFVPCRRPARRAVTHGRPAAGRRRSSGPPAGGPGPRREPRRAAG